MTLNFPNNTRRELHSGAEHSIYDMKFRRKFSVNPYKTLQMKLGEMSFSKDWLNTSRGDPYPVVGQDGEGTLTETTGNGRFAVRNFSRRSADEARLLGQHFPYATYELVLHTLDHASAGFLISAMPGDRSAYTEENTPVLRVSLVRVPGRNTVRIAYELTVGGVSRGEVTEEREYPYVPGMSLILTCRGRFFDVYLRDDKRPVSRLTLDLPEFSEIIRHGTFVNAIAAHWYRCAPNGSFTADEVKFYLDAGVSHADMKTIRYEDGTPIMSDGKLFLTLSSRLEAGGFQSVISWNPSTAEFRMEGAIFFDCGDDRWCSDVASSVIFNRYTNEWYIWACSFSHGHILCHGTSIADLRYGINVIDAELMPTETLESADASTDSLAAQAGASAGSTAALSDDTLWLAKSGDEDPDFVYDRETGKWYMMICRGVRENGGTHYRYFLYESDEPFSGYRYVDKTLTGSNTGGSIVRVGGKLQFVCGSNFDKRACYHVYDLHDLSKVDYIRCDFDDGGFRGWGTVIPVPCGNRTKYMWMTFDRHGGSSYNWSYGNIYVYESDLMNSGYEGGIQYNL
ncbi:MAG: hypothetical protein IKU40_00135 [Clostridia bacterium]|nr:hypothetical protein [Clostridia bacterium]